MSTGKACPKKIKKERSRRSNEHEEGQKDKRFSFNLFYLQTNTTQCYMLVKFKCIFSYLRVSNDENSERTIRL